MSKKAVAKDVRFVKNADGTVTDNLLKVMWGSTLSEAMPYSKAEKACKECDFAGYKDWRLPTVNELFSLVDRKKHHPAIDTSIFPDTKNDWYWTNEEYVGYSGYGWVVDFGFGVVSGGCHSGINCVRPVRAIK